MMVREMCTWMTGLDWQSVETILDCGSRWNIVSNYDTQTYELV